MGGSSKTTAESKPPAWAEGLFKQSATDASNLYNSGVGGNTYMGSTVADLSPTTMSGVNQLAQAGGNWRTDQTRPIYNQLGTQATSNPFMNMLTSFANSAGSAGQDAMSNPFIRGLTELASNTQSQNVDTSGIQGRDVDTSGIVGRGVSAGDYRGILNRAQAPTAASQYLTSTARGDFLKEGNPYYRDRLDKEILDSNAMLRSQFSGLGRSGSGVDQRAIGENTSNMLMQGLENDWNRERANQFTATGMMDAANQGALGTQLGAAGGIAGIGTGNADRGLQAGIARAGFDAGNADRSLGAATTRAGFDAGNADRSLRATDMQGNMLTNAGGMFSTGVNQLMQALGLQSGALTNAGGMYSTGIGQGLQAANSMAGMDQQQFANRLTGADATLKAGGIVDTQAQKQLSDEVNKWYGKDNEAWTRLGMLQGAAGGAAGPYGVQASRTSQTPGIGQIASAVGGLFGGK